MQTKADKKSDVINATGAAAGNIEATNYMVDDVDRFVTPRGHGFAAEQMNDYWDKVHGHDAKVVGGNNAKDGADRIVDGIEIQTKYCKTGSKCIGECFENGKFRYINSAGKPMQIEVPSDKYDDAIKAMESRIKRGEVPGITDPKEAKNIIRKGNFTYEQARNVARFGTVESITLDAANGTIVASYAFGISTAMNFAVSVWNGKPFDEALKNSASAGLKVGGAAFVTTVLSSQMQRTALNSLLRGSTDQIVQIMGPKASAYLANAFRSGANLSGAAAMQSASKLLRGNAITGAITVAVLSTFDVANLFRGRISGKQLFKNVSKTAATVAGGTGGWVAGASAGAAIGSFIPVIGTAVGGVAGGLIGSLAGGSAAGKASSAVLDGMIEDDAVEMQGILEQEFKQLAEDYLINQKEAEKICDRFSGIVDGDFLKKMFASESRHSFANKRMLPLFEDVAKKRKKIVLPSEEQMVNGLKSVLNYVADHQEDGMIEEKFVTEHEEEENMSKKQDPVLERKYNWYVQKVIYNESSGGIDTIVKAIAEYMVDVENLDNKDDLDFSTYGEWHNIRSGDTEIDVKVISDDDFLVKVEEVYDNDSDRENYYCNMFTYLEDYMEKIGSNKCPVCGEEIVGKGKFCANCGATL